MSSGTTLFLAVIVSCCCSIVWGQFIPPQTNPSCPALSCPVDCTKTAGKWGWDSDNNCNTCSCRCSRAIRCGTGCSKGSVHRTNRFGCQISCSCVKSNRKGSCPILKDPVQLCLRPGVHQCLQDFHCPGRKKCCGCPASCHSPVSGSNSRKCPRGFRGFRRCISSTRKMRGKCSRNSDCSKEKVCCGATKLCLGKCLKRRRG